MTTVTETRHAMKLAAHTTPWEDRIACHNRPEDWWDGENAKLTEKARKVCLGCPVLAECLGEQMELEKAQVWSRAAVRGGLTGPERIQLYIDQQVDGAYDAEEARLLALESLTYGQPVRELAEDGVSESTVRLGARLAGERVESRQPMKATEGTAIERALQNASQIMEWREANVSQKEIAARLKIGRTSVDAVVRTYKSLLGEGVAPVAVTAEDAERVLVDAYLKGDPVRLTHEQQLKAVAESVTRGMTYLDIDRLQGQAPNTTAQFVSRMRQRYMRAGREFPFQANTPRQLKDEHVLEMRELYAAGGVTDLELSLRYGVTRNVISHALNGKNYKHVGGPIRSGRTAEAKQASKEANDRVCRVAFAAGRAKKMEQAA